MFYLVLKALLSGVLVAAVSETAKRSPALGALVASLPIVSVLGMVWLWGETRDPERLAAHAEATFWLVLPSLPMFLLLPQVKLAKRLDVKGAAERGLRRLPGRFVVAWERESGRPAP